MDSDDSEDLERCIVDLDEIKDAAREFLVLPKNHKKKVIVLSNDSIMEQPMDTFTLQTNLVNEILKTLDENQPNSYYLDDSPSTSAVPQPTFNNHDTVSDHQDIQNPYFDPPSTSAADPQPTFNDHDAEHNHQDIQNPYFDPPSTSAADPLLTVNNHDADRDHQDIQDPDFNSPSISAVPPPSFNNHDAESDHQDFQDPDFNPKYMETDSDSSDSSLIEVTQENTSSTQGQSLSVIVPKRKSKGQGGLRSRDLAKAQREKGDSYIGYRRRPNDGGRSVRMTQDNPKNAKVMGPPCNSVKCEKLTTRSCHAVSQLNRQQLFTRPHADFSIKKAKKAPSKS